VDVAQLGVVASVAPGQVLDMAVRSPLQEEMDLLEVVPLDQDRQSRFPLSVDQVDVGASG